MTTRKISPRSAAARELRSHLVEFRTALEKAEKAKRRGFGWKYRQVLEFADLVLKSRNDTRPASIAGLRNALAECELAARLCLPPDHSAQRLAAKATRAVLQSYPFSRHPPGPPRASRPSCAPQAY